MSDIKIDVSNGESYALRPGDSLTIKNNTEDEEVWREEYRKKQAAGVKFECLQITGNWIVRDWDFGGTKERYREVPQEDFDINKIASSLSPPTSSIPHLAERALYWAQRVAGTNEVWQVCDPATKMWIDTNSEPNWLGNLLYRVKPETVKRYMALLKSTANQVYPFVHGSRWDIVEHAKKWNLTIIGNIEEREVEID